MAMEHTEERTIFHKIRDRELPADILYEDDDVLVFRDIRPQAPTHLLFLPKTFAPSAMELTKATEHLPGMLILKARDFAKMKGIAGYKLMFHVGKEGGQIVPYLHLHFLAEKKI